MSGILKELKQAQVEKEYNQVWKVFDQINELFDTCDQDSIRAYFTQEYDMQTDEYDIELSDLNTPYTITLI